MQRKLPLQRESWAQTRRKKNDEQKKATRAATERLRDFCVSFKDGDEIMASRGAVRSNHLEAFLIYQAREKTAKKVSGKKKEFIKQNKKTIHRVNREGLGGLLGEKRAAILLAMEPIPFEIEKCPYTGRTDDPDLLVYVVDEKKVEEMERRTSSSQVDTDAVTANEQDLHDLAMQDDKELVEKTAEDNGASGTLAVKQESPEAVEQTQDDIIFQRFDRIIANPKPEIQELQGMKVDWTDWRRAATGQPYATNLISVIGGSLPDLMGAIEMLEDVVKGEATERDIAGKIALITLLEHLRSKHLEIADWAVTLKVIEAKPKGVKRARKSETKLDD